MAAVAVLLAWVAYATFSGETSHAWDPVPQGQPYYEPMVAPHIPASADTSKLPPMVASAPSADITLRIDAPPLGGMYGPTGQVQDAYSPAYFSVPAGVSVKVTVLNYDTAWHTFTAPTLGLDVWVRPSAPSHPSVTTFHLSAPATGYFEWFCNVPCDPTSMEGPGYMVGEVHAVRS